MATVGGVVSGVFALPFNRRKLQLHALDTRLVLMVDNYLHHHLHDILRIHITKRSTLLVSLCDGRSSDRNVTEPHLLPRVSESSLCMMTFLQNILRARSSRRFGYGQRI